MSKGNTEQRIREARIARLARTMTEAETLEVERLMKERPKATRASKEAWRGAVEVVLAERNPLPERLTAATQGACTGLCRYELIDGSPWFVFGPDCQRHSRMARRAYTQQERDFTSVEVAA